MTLSFHLSRRGLDATNGIVTNDPKHGDGQDIPIPPLAGLIFFLSVFAIMIVMFTAMYTYEYVIPTLCMIESPETATYVPVNVIDSSAPPAYPGTDDEQDVDPEVLLIQNKPVTSSLRLTVQHLRARAGFWSRFRGISLFICCGLVGGLISSSVAGIFHSRFGAALGTIVADTILARWYLTWVHIVISEPSEKRWYQRVPHWNTWKKIAPAVALWSTTNQIVMGLPLLITGSFGPVKHMKDPGFSPHRHHVYALGGQGFLGVILMLSLYLLLTIPATVTMVRVAASMLPEEDETIVPFDRTFGGKTTPTIIGGQGKIGIVEAWRSFPWASRVRLLRLMGKIFLVFITLWLVFIIIMVLEVQLLFGEQAGEIMKSIHGAAGQH